MAGAAQEQWVYRGFTDPISTRLVFYLERDRYGDRVDTDVRPPSLKEWKETVDRSRWLTARPEVEAVSRAGARPGGKFEFPEGAGPANDALMEIYELMNGRPEEALDALEARAEDMPEDLDAWVCLAELYGDRNEPREALCAATRGLAIAEGAMPRTFSGAVEYGIVDNRPFHRCLGVFANLACDAGALDVAAAACVAQLWLNPHDNMGARYLLHEIRAGGADEEPGRRPCTEGRVVRPHVSRRSRRR